MMTSDYVTLMLKLMFTLPFVWSLGEVASSPRFTSQSQQLGVLEGGHVTLQCAVIGLDGDDAVFWNHGSLMLSMNEHVFVPHRSISVTPGDGDGADTAADGDSVVTYSLRLDSVTLQDEGVYSCQVPSQPSLIQRHRIVINVVPTISELSPESGWTKVTEGESVQLTCRATGKPDPVITWTHRQRELDSNSERNVGVGEVLTVDSVTRQDGGLYVCTADNGAGSKSRDFVIDVQYGPLAEVADAEVYVGYDQQTEISCIVRANPAADVTWIHNDTPVNEFDNMNAFASVIPQNEKDMYLAKLTIYRVGVDDVGKYRCVSSNGFGYSTATLAIIGLPVNTTLQSEREGVLGGDKYTLLWTVRSLSPLISHQLQLRVLSSSERATNGTADDWRVMELSADDVREYDEEDTNSVAPAGAVMSLGVRRLRYTLTGLTANTSYTGRLRATNVFGSSDWSSEFSFITALQQAVRTETSAASTTLLPARLQRANHHRQTAPNGGTGSSSWSLKAGSLLVILLQLTANLRHVNI